MKPLKLSLDSMIFIYLFEEDRRYINVIKPFFEKIEEGKFNAYTSIITPLEVLSSSKLKKDPDKRAVFVRFFQKFSNLYVKNADWDIMEKAAELRRKYFKLRTPDAIQLATAIVFESHFFITNDKKLIDVDAGSVKIRLVEEAGRLI